jgi:manganese/zinc/iron transport system substrate-binding protein
LVDLIVRRQISAVFVESSVPWKSLEAVVEGVTSRGHQVTIGGELFSDSCGPSGTYEGTYLGMMDHNLTLITRALGGIAPPGGFRGRLSLTDPERTDPELTEATP